MLEDALEFRQTDKVKFLPKEKHLRQYINCLILNGLRVSLFLLLSKLEKENTDSVL